MDKIIIIGVIIIVIFFVVGFIFNSNKNNSYNHHTEEFDRIYSNINHLSVDDLEKIHNALMNYSLQVAGLWAFSHPEWSSEEIKRKQEETRRQKIESGPIYGCVTYGDAEVMNTAVVKRLKAIKGDDY